MVPEVQSPEGMGGWGPRPLPSAAGLVCAHQAGEQSLA